LQAWPWLGPACSFRGIGQPKIARRDMQKDRHLAALRHRGKISLHCNISTPNAEARINFCNDSNYEFDIYRLHCNAYKYIVNFATQHDSLKSSIFTLSFTPAVVITELLCDKWPKIPT
jgi:hypothetical protein